MLVTARHILTHNQFYDIPPSAPDLSTHMEDLAWQYPAEPVERAAARFCEAIAKWRGKPELETVSYNSVCQPVNLLPYYSTRRNRPSLPNPVISTTHLATRR